jgi:hypothetical protein
VAENKINREVYGRFFDKKYKLACALLDCEAFKSWHTPLRSEWSDVWTAIKKMGKQFDWPLYEVTRADEDAAATQTMNTGLLLNGIHQLLDVFRGHNVKFIPSPQQWGDIMRVVDETTEHRALVDRAVKLPCS